jgi:hypothetical protein
MVVRPTAVAFDVVETLMSLQALGGRLEQVGQPASLLPAWFSRLLLYGVGLSAAGDYVPFPDAAAEALRAVSGYEIAERDVEYVLAGFGELPAQPDAEPAMRRRGLGAGPAGDEEVPGPGAEIPHCRQQARRSAAVPGGGLGGGRDLLSARRYQVIPL